MIIEEEEEEDAGQTFLLYVLLLVKGKDERKNEKYDVEVKDKGK